MQKVTNIAVTTKAVATIFGVTGQTVQNWTRAGKLPHWRTIGGRARYDLADILDLKERLGARTNANSTG